MTCGGSLPKGESSIFGVGVEKTYIHFSVVFRTGGY